jgi:hypothetical protein
LLVKNDKLTVIVVLLNIRNKISETMPYVNLTSSNI